MAERAEAVNVEALDRNLAPIVPVRPDREIRAPEPDTLTAIKQRATAGYGEAMEGADRSHSALAEKSNTSFSDIRHWTQRVCNEHPLQVVAIVAGAAFVLGVALRIYKSNRYA